MMKRGGGARSRVTIDILLDQQARLAQMAEDVRAGLTSAPKYLLPKYFYDATGSTLFDQITRLPEYYLTRAEETIMALRTRDVMATLRPAEIVELGAGSSTKARWLLNASDPAHPVQRYIPIDVDPEAVRASAKALTRDFAALNVHGFVGDIQRHLGSLPPATGRRLVTFLGSTIGNFHPEDQRDLFRQVRALLGPEDRFLLGADLVKDAATLERAYNDAAGVTAAFNRNILRVVNTALDGDFNPLAFRHYAFFNTIESRIEMHLTAGSPQTARLRRLPLTVMILAGESIWTENSYKFTRAMVARTAEDAGMSLEAWFTDSAGSFGLALMRPSFVS